MKKGVSWALRMIGRRNLALNGAALAVARRLSRSEPAAARSVGKEALRELETTGVRSKLVARRKPPGQGRQRAM